MPCACVASPLACLRLGPLVLPQAAPALIRVVHPLPPLLATSFAGYSTNYTETLSSVEVFDPNTDTWTQVCAPGRCLAGAWPLRPQPTLHRPQAPCSREASGMQPLAPTAPPLSAPACLQLQQPMPTPRGDVMCSALSLGGVEHFVVVGGYFDPTNAFTIGAFRCGPCKGCRAVHAHAAAAAARLPQAHQVTRHARHPHACRSEVEAYNPEDASWTTLAPIPEVRASLLWGGGSAGACCLPAWLAGSCQGKASQRRLLNVPSHPTPPCRRRAATTRSSRCPATA